MGDDRTVVGVTVAELRALLVDMPDDARVFVSAWLSDVGAYDSADVVEMVSGDVFIHTADD